MTNRYIVDTTLRDGEQSPGMAFSIREKITIAKALDTLGVARIEAGTRPWAERNAGPLKKSNCPVSRRRLLAGTG